MDDNNFNIEKLDPIFEFKGLKELLTSLGYQVEKAVGYRPVENKDVDLNELRNNIEFSNDGIFLIDPENDSRQQIFLYKRNYRLSRFGKPRFHIRKCSVIQSFMASGTFKKEYRRANSEPVMVCDMDDDYKDKEVSNLPLCKYCLKLAMQDGIFKGMNSADFVEILKQASDASDDNEENKVDIFGYVKNWEEVSRAYREKMNYTCERCGVHIEDPFDYHYIHVHHKNGNKADNHERNLECLCIRCHAKVDDIHYDNFNSGANAIILKEFNKKYPKW